MASAPAKEVGDGITARTSHQAGLAALRNLFFTGLCLAGGINIAAARRTTSPNPRSIAQVFTRLSRAGQNGVTTEPCHPASIRTVCRSSCS